MSSSSPQNPKNSSSWVQFCMSMGKTILHSREMRRKVLFQLVITLVIVVAIGVWPLSDWLDERLPLFLLWWAGCVIYTVMIILLAIYDMLVVFKEERDKM